MIDLKPRHLLLIRQILEKRAPDAEAYVFGSRAGDTATAVSDLDLALTAPQPLASSVMEELEWEFSESDLPFRVDIIDLKAADEEFKAAIAGSLTLLR